MKTTGMMAAASVLGLLALPATAYAGEPNGPGYFYLLGGQTQYDQTGQPGQFVMCMDASWDSLTGTPAAGNEIASSYCGAGPYQTFKLTFSDGGYVHIHVAYTNYDDLCVEAKPTNGTYAPFLDTCSPTNQFQEWLDPVGDFAQMTPGAAFRNRATGLVLDVWHANASPQFMDLTTANGTLAQAILPIGFEINLELTDSDPLGGLCLGSAGGPSSWQPDLGVCDWSGEEAVELFDTAGQGLLDLFVKTASRGHGLLSYDPSIPYDLNFEADGAGSSWQLTMEGSGSSAFAAFQNLEANVCLDQLGGGQGYESQTVDAWPCQPYDVAQSWTIGFWDQD